MELRARLYASGRIPSSTLPRPTLSVGNLTFGGTGKTPFVEFLAKRFRFEGKRPAVLSRGYRRRSRGLIVVSRGEGPVVNAEDGGDEPVSLAHRLPGVIVVVAESRAKAAHAASELGADLLILDDGYQHLAVRRDVNLLLLDAADPFGSGRLPPFGTLREPLSSLARADLAVFTRASRGAPSAEALAKLHQFHPNLPFYTARIRPAGLWDEQGSPLEASALARRFIAVCGVANPAGFSASLGELELSPEETLHFRDHHSYLRRDIERIRRAAERSASTWIVTTEKDAVKLSGRLALPLITMRLRVEVVEPGFFAFLSARLFGRSQGREERSGIGAER